MSKQSPLEVNRASKHSPHSSKLQQTPLDHATTPANFSKLQRMVTLTMATMHNRRSGGGLQSQNQKAIRRPRTPNVCRDEFASFFADTRKPVANNHPAPANSSKQPKKGNHQ
jgi:hypothetical protein